MSANDCIVLDGAFEAFQKEEKLEVGKAFDKFVFQLLLKDEAPSNDQLEFGWIDGGEDGGIDGIYILVNGYLYVGDKGFQWPRENPHITVWVITCKHDKGYKLAPLESMHATLSEFWDCSKTNQVLTGTYNSDLLKVRGTFLHAYHELAHRDPRVDIHLVYASRGDSGEVAPAVKNRMKQLEEQARRHFSKGEVYGEFVGARELLMLHRKNREEHLVLPFVSHLSHDDSNYVVISKLKDYYHFVQNEEGKLRRYLFDSNVRGYLGYNAVNDDIDATLQNPDGANFWWLNNGITILADKAHITGKNLHLTGAQIVNGLQTTETLYRHFASGRKESFKSDILIKVMTSREADIRSRIVAGNRKAYRTFRG